MWQLKTLLIPRCPYFKMKTRKCFAVNAKMPTNSLTEIRTFRLNETLIRIDIVCVLISEIQLYFLFFNRCRFRTFNLSSFAFICIFVQLHLTFIHYCAICNRSASVDFTTFIKDYMLTTELIREHLITISCALYWSVSVFKTSIDQFRERRLFPRIHTMQNRRFITWIRRAYFDLKIRGKYGQSVKVNSSATRALSLW